MTENVTLLDIQKRNMLRFFVTVKVLRGFILGAKTMSVTFICNSVTFLKTDL